MRSFLFSVLSIGLAAGAGAPGTKLATLHAAAAAETPEDEQPPSSDTWPRKVTIDGATVTIYQPQVEKWDGNRLEASAAVAVETRASPRPTYGVIRLGARTEVDKEDRLVTLYDMKVTSAKFPAAPDKAEEYLEAIRKALPQGTLTTSLDRLEAGLTVSRLEARGKQVPVKNDPPRIIFSTRPAVLVLIDGKPALRQVDGVKLLRVINTRALLLFDEDVGKFYLHLMDRWMEARSLDGPWTVAEDPPAALQKVLEKFADDPQVDLLDNLSEDLKDALENGIVPAIYMSTVPAELIQTEGEPELAPIEGTNLLWVKNTTSIVLMDTRDQYYYVLLSGRWFRSKSLEKGPWEYVPRDKLPADFAKVPETHPRGDLLASVPGTPQAEEAAIAGQMPQTATIKRSEARLEPIYDGAPQFQPIEGTQLAYAVNTPTPIIQLSPDSYYACENGVWFASAAPTGPWAAATYVPDVIYTIPPSAPVYYVTHVYVYGSTPDYVYTGYTPGYLGTCIDPYGVVVYGTGWNFFGWVGQYWFGRPWCYGWGVHFCWTEGGFGFGFAVAWGRPWWGPLGWHAGWGGRWWRHGWERGWGGRYADIHINNINFNNFNIYHRWSDRVYVNAPHIHTTTRNTVINAAHNNVSVSRPRTSMAIGRRELNNVLAGRDGNIYRREANGWAIHSPEGWRPVEPSRLPPERRSQFADVSRRLNQEWAARRAGAARYNTFRAAARNPVGHPIAVAPHVAVGGPAGFHGGYSGFRNVPAYHPAVGGRVAAHSPVVGHGRR
jgi:hypothetical protein